MINTDKKVRFDILTNKSKRKVYKEISKRYNNNTISPNIKFDFKTDIPKMAVHFFESYTYLFYCYKMKIKI